MLLQAHMQTPKSGKEIIIIPTRDQLKSPAEINCNIGVRFTNAPT